MEISNAIHYFWRRLSGCLGDCNVWVGGWLVITAIVNNRLDDLYDRSLRYRFWRGGLCSSLYD